jgi:hypothetical protein
LGITMAMYYNDHNPPHFHVLYNEYDAEIEISNLPILEEDHRAIIRELLDKNLFKTVKVNLNTLCWDNDVDFAPDYLYDQIKIKEKAA